MSDTVSDLDLDAIKARAEAATPGPWRADDEHDVEGYDLVPAWCVSATKNDGEWAYDLAYVSHDHTDKAGKQEALDAEFIAHARSDVPALVAEVRRLRELVGEDARQCGHKRHEWWSCAANPADKTRTVGATFGRCFALSRWLRRGVMSADPRLPRPEPDERQMLVVNGCTDMEQHARSFNEGYETAVAQGLADDPTLASDWLDEHDRQVKLTLLAEADYRIGEPRLPTVATHGPDYVDGYHDGATHATRVVAEIRSELTNG